MPAPLPSLGPSPAPTPKPTELFDAAILAQAAGVFNGMGVFLLGLVGTVALARLNVVYRHCTRLEEEKTAAKREAADAATVEACAEAARAAATAARLAADKAQKVAAQQAALSIINTRLRVKRQQSRLASAFQSRQDRPERNDDDLGLILRGAVSALWRPSGVVASARATNVQEVERAVAAADDEAAAAARFVAAAAAAAAADEEADQKTAELVTFLAGAGIEDQAAALAALGLTTVSDFLALAELPPTFLVRRLVKEASLKPLQVRRLRGALQAAHGAYILAQPGSTGDDASANPLPNPRAAADAALSVLPRPIARPEANDGALFTEALRGCGFVPTASFKGENLAFSLHRGSSRSPSRGTTI